MTPDEFTNQELMLDVGDGHQIYIHDWGNKDAKTPIFHLHGGPGSGSSDRDKPKYNPITQRVIFHDQRGSGKSLPTGSLKNNTAPHLVADIEKVASNLAINRFVLAGGSWGSTLALLYGIAHPEQVVGMVIDGVFTATKSEIEWADKGGWSIFFPEEWQKYQTTVPEAERQDPSNYHYQQVLHGDSESAKKSAYEFSNMESSIVKLDGHYTPESFDKFDPTSSFIEMHYLANNCFLEDDYIMDNAARLTMPIYMIQGRYDMVCPPKTAYKLSKKLPKGKLIWTINGHVKQYEAKNFLGVLLDQLVGED